MKNLYLFLILSSFCLLSLSSCQIELADKDKIEMAKKRQAEKQKQRKKEQLEKKNQAKKDKKNQKNNPVVEERLPTPPFEDLTASRKQTAAAINQVNGAYVMMTDDPIKIEGNSIKIKGTAIDRPLAKAPSGAYIKIGAKTFPVDTWKERKKFADKAKNPDYLMTSFEIEIPTSELTPGTKIMTLLVVSSDRENYYTVNEKVKIII